MPLYYIREYNIEAWDDTRIAAGSNWQEVLEKALQSAKAAVLLISPDFLASDFIADHELPPILAAAEQRNLTVLSIIIKSSAFKDTPLFRFQSVNAPSNPLALMSPAKRDEIWKKAAEMVRDILRNPSS